MQDMASESAQDAMEAQSRAEEVMVPEWVHPVRGIASALEALGMQVSPMLLCKTLARAWPAHYQHACFHASMTAYMVESTAFLRGLVMCLQHMVQICNARRRSACQRAAAQCASMCMRTYMSARTTYGACCSLP